jgi:hypothetical protein
MVLIFRREERTVNRGYIVPASATLAGQVKDGSLLGSFDVHQRLRILAMVTLHSLSDELEDSFLKKNNHDHMMSSHAFMKPWDGCSSLKYLDNGKDMRYRKMHFFFRVPPGSLPGVSGDP